MGTRDPRIDAYIAGAAPFARPILRHLRTVVHASCPDVEETLKWGMPAFMHHGILCMMSAFKAHASFGFWRGRLIVDRQGKSAMAGMGDFGRLTAVADLPARQVLAGYVKQAMQLNAAGARPKGTSPRRRPAPVTPGDLRAALRRSARARATWDAFAPSHKRDYVEWITEAKRPDTRSRRVATTVEWLGQGKRRNWKHEA